MLPIHNTRALGADGGPHVARTIESPMDLQGNKPLFFATDLTNFLACRHLTALERLAAHKLAKRPFFDDPMLEILRERGLEHERAYVQRLAQSGMRVIEINRSPTALGETINAMREGVDVVVQARLEHRAWAGWADVLLRVPGESRFGAWRYEPVETKLAKETRGATLIQLCLYADLLAELQGSPPALLRVVVPERNSSPSATALRSSARTSGSCGGTSRRKSRSLSPVR